MDYNCYAKRCGIEKKTFWLVTNTYGKQTAALALHALADTNVCDSWQDIIATFHACKHAVQTVTKYCIWEDVVE